MNWISLLYFRHIVIAGFRFRSASFSCPFGVEEFWCAASMGTRLPAVSGTRGVLPRLFAQRFPSSSLPGPSSSRPGPADCAWLVWQEGRSSASLHGNDGVLGGGRDGIHARGPRFHVADVARWRVRSCVCLFSMAVYRSRVPSSKLKKSLGLSMT